MNLVVVVISMHVISETLKREKIYCLKHYLMQISRKIYVNYDLQRSLCLIYYPKSCKIQYLCVFERKKIWELSLIFNGETSWLDILHVSFKMGFKTPQPLKYNKTSFFMTQWFNWNYTYTTFYTLHMLQFSTIKMIISFRAI